MKVKSFVIPAFASKQRLKDDNNACAVIAVANAFGMSSEEATSLCAIHGRKHGQGMRLDYMHNLVTSLNAKFIGVFGTTNAAMWLGEKVKETKTQVNYHKGKTLKSFMEDFKSGTYLICITNHFTVIKNGKLCDVGMLNGSVSVTGAWKID